MTMMQVQAIIKGKERKYEVDLTETPLGAGATAVVRRGEDHFVAKNDPYQTVAVKIAYRNTPRPQLAQFQDEYKLLEKLAGTNHVPRAFLGTVLGGDGQPDETLRDHIIIQEYISAKWELRRFAAADHRLPVDIALASAHQYVTLLQAMHERNIVSMGDRKATDLRWLQTPDQPPRLVVLDWNRAREVSEKEKQALIRQDIQAFGRLWAEQLLARDVQDLPDVDDISDATWSSLRRGLRLILKQSLDSRFTWGYQSAADILQDIDKYKEDEQKSCQQLIAEAEDEQKKGAANPVERVSHAQRILTLLDWAETHKEIGDYKEHIEKLKLWVETSFSAALRAVEPAIELIKKNLDKRRGYYDEALHVYSNYRPNIVAVTPADHLALLRLTRWAIVAEVGHLGLTQFGQTMGDPIDYLMACVGALENNSDLKAHTQYTAFLEWVAQQNKEELIKLTSAASPLLDEIEIRQSLT